MKNLIFTLVLYSCLINVIPGQDIYNSNTNNYILSNEMSNWVDIKGTSIFFEKNLRSFYSDRLMLNAKAGTISGLNSPIFIDTKKYSGGLATLSLSTGNDNHQFEINSGVYIISEAIFFDNKENSSMKRSIIPLVNLGYKYQTNGITFTINASLLGGGIGLGFVL